MSKTRSKTSRNSKSSKEVVSKNIFGDKKIFFIQDKFMNEDESTLEIVSLRNPCTNQKSMYLFSPTMKNQVYEIIEFNEPNRSWFINQSVSSNGCIYLTTQIDPVFLLLGYIYKECQESAIPLDHIFIDEEFPETSRLLPIAEECTGQLEMISECRTAGSFVAVKYNEEKTLNWLQKKCEKLVEVLRNKRIHVGQGAVSATFIKSEKLEESIDSGEGLRYAHGIISDYLPEAISEKLAKHLNIPEESLTKKRKNPTDVQPKNIKKSKLDDSDVMDNENGIQETSFEKTEKIAEKKVSAKEKALAKAASGTKSISSFFMKKN